MVKKELALCGIPPDHQQVEAVELPEHPLFAGLPHAALKRDEDDL